MSRIVKTTSLYTLIVKPDQSFEIKIDGESMKNGTLLDDFTPAVNPEKEIDDPKDEKPSDWVDEARIPDPEATKPEDWDEDAPYEIVDEEATKPDDWLDDEPTNIPDPEAEKPEDWDEEEDGDWIPPTVPNPKCEEASGCGKWEPPMKKNPDYKGKWSPEYIDNPEYKGVWKPKKIANPDYFEDKTPANFEPMGAVSRMNSVVKSKILISLQIGFEIWTMQSDILFDNIYIGHSIEDAEKLKSETFDIKHKVEVAEEDATKPPPVDDDEIKSPSDLKFMDDPVHYAREKLDLFIAIAKNDPLEAIKFVPEVSGAIGAIFAILIAIVIGSLTSSGATPPPQVKKAAEKAKQAAVDGKDQLTDAVSSGAEKVQSEINKRTTRSAGPAE